MRLESCALVMLGACSLASVGAAQAVLNPNQIVGSITWTNTNRSIRSILDERTCYQWTVEAESVGLSEDLGATISGYTDCRGHEVDRYELTVESSPPGIAYDVTATSWQVLRPTYVFATARSTPVRLEPAPDVTVAFAECAGLFRFLLPTNVTGGRIDAWRDGEGSLDDPSDVQAEMRIDSGVAAADLLVRGDGHLYHVRVRLTTGTDPFLDRLTYEAWIDLVGTCDVVTEIDCTGGPGSIIPGGGGGGGGLSRVVGVYDLVGEREIPRLSSNRGAQLSMISLFDGPWSNSRYDDLVGDPASGAFTLPNLIWSDVVAPPKPYSLQAASWLRGGAHLQTFRSPYMDVIVPASATLDLAEALVMRPAILSGEIHLAGPPPSGAFGSVLQHATPSGSDAPGWSPPFGMLNETRVIVGGTRTIAPGASRPTWGAETSAAFPLEFDAATGDVNALYECVLGMPENEPAVFDASAFVLSTQRRLAPAVPDDDVSCKAMVLDHAAAALLVHPDDRPTFDRDYCVSQVNLSFYATSGTFFHPQLWGYGGLDDDDYRGAEVDYDVNVTADGTPVEEADAATTGRVTMALPSGDYVLQPTVQAINPVDGHVSTTDVMPVTVSVGCRQIIDVYPEMGILVDVNDVPPCAEAGTIEISGRVTSTEQVTRIEWSVSGSAPVTVCTSCGISPSFVAPVVLADADNEIVISATDVRGRTASVTSFTRWAREPSALDLRPGSAPLRVGRDASGGLRITWEPGGTANVYRGTIASLHDDAAYDHAGIGACGVAGGSAMVPADAGSFYFLAAAPCSWGDGSLGRDSLGRERPQARGACR